MTEDEMVGWHHRLTQSEQTLGESEGQGSLACCSLWGHKESDMIEQQIMCKSFVEDSEDAAIPFIPVYSHCVTHRLLPNRGSIFSIESFPELG